MERLLVFLLIIFCDMHAADFGEAKLKKPELQVNHVELAIGFYLYTISIQDKQQEVGKVQFKFYDAIKQPKSSQIDYIIIAEHMRNEGKGDSLLKAALKMMKELGCSLVKTKVDTDNKASLRLFEKNGFLKDGPGLSKVLGGETIHMQKQL